MSSNNGANKGSIEKTPAEPEEIIKMEEIKETKSRRGSGFSGAMRLVGPDGEVLQQVGDLSDGGYWGDTNNYDK